LPQSKEKAMAAYDIVLLGTAGPRQSDSALDLNNRRTVVGVVHTSWMRAVKWSPIQALLWPAAPTLELSVACGVNDPGQVVGGGGSQNWPGQAFLHSNGVTQSLASVFGAEMSQAQDINNKGVIVGWAGRTGQPRAFRYDSVAAGAPVELGSLAGHKTSYANAINDKGQVTGISRNPGANPDSRAFLHDQVLTELGPAAFSDDINDAGQVVGARVFEDASHWTAFLCETASGKPQFHDLGALKLPGFVGSHAHGINKQGDIVGSSFTDFGAGQLIRAWVRPAGGAMQDLNALIAPNSGWLLHSASAINNEGQIAGTGSFGGEYRAYLLTPAPAPTGETSLSPWRALIDRLGLFFGWKKP
jgi:probable HAF family extracellular repeat protein